MSPLFRIILAVFQIEGVFSAPTSITTTPTAIPKNGCDDFGVWHSHGEQWIRTYNFVVRCEDGNVEVVECITDAGSVVPLGTKKFLENGIEYSCMDEGSGSEAEELGEEQLLAEMTSVGGSVSLSSSSPSADSDSDPDLDVLCESSSDVVIHGFLLCCASKRIKGCVDAEGDLVKQGFFTTASRQLKLCTVHPSGLRGRIENKGCFNGSRSDDVDDESWHIAKYAVWREGDVDLRCGDNGIHAYRCYVREQSGERKLYVGSAWIDEQGDFNTCK